MLFRTVWDAPVRQFEKEACLSLGTEVEYVALNCMGYAVRQFEKRS